MTTTAKQQLMKRMEEKKKVNKRNDDQADEQWSSHHKNKLPFFSLLTDWRFTRGVEEQTKAFLDGFNEVVPLEWLRYFDEKELEVRRSGRAARRASKIF